MRLFFAGLLLLGTSPVSGEPLKLTDSPQIAAGPALEELIGDHTLDEALDSLSWNKLTAAPNYGFTDRVIWLRLRVNADAPSSRILYIDAWMKDLQMSVVRGEKRTTVDLGHAARFAEQAERFRRIAVPFEFEKGETLFLFRLHGEDTVRFPLQIWKPSAFQRFRDATTVLFAAYFGAMLIMVVYNLFIYVSTREKSYLPYVFYVSAAMVYFAGQSGFLLQFTTLGPGAARLHLFAAGLFISTLGAFAISFLQLRSASPAMFWTLMLLIFCGLASSCMALVPSIPFSLVARIESYAALATLPAVMVAAVRRWFDGYSPARFFVLAFSLFVAGAAFFVLGLLGVLPFNLLTGQGIMIGSVIEVALLSLALSDRINFLKRSIEGNLSALNAARLEIEASEKKYRSLVEDSGDLIFTLDQSGVITGANNAAFSILGIRARNLTGREFSSLIHDAHGSAGLQGALLAESMKTLDRGPAQFRMLLNSSMDEPVELVVRMERIGTGGDSFVLGKASHAAEDSLLRFLNVERGRYELDNYLANLELLNQRITRNLARYFSPGESVLLQTCLREILMNSVEHGHLRVDPAKKRAAQAAGKYVEFLADALKNPSVESKRIRVAYSINSARSWFQVSDEGAGFDYEAELKRTSQGADVTGGRGLAMATTFFDVVRFQDGGRTVSLVKFTGGTG